MGDDARVASSDHSGSDASGAGPVMLLAASPDVDTSDDAKASDKTDTKAQSNSVWCRENYVSEKDCDEWVADQLARRAARNAEQLAKQRSKNATRNGVTMKLGVGMKVMGTMPVLPAVTIAVAMLVGLGL